MGFLEGLLNAGKEVVTFQPFNGWSSKGGTEHES